MCLWYSTNLIAAGRRLWSIVDLFLDLINPIPRLSLRGFDLEAVLLGGGREEAPHAVGLPRSCFHNLGQGRPFGPPDLSGLGFLLGGLGFSALGATKESTLTAESFRKYGLRYFLGPGGKLFVSRQKPNAGIPTKNGVVVTRSPVALGFLK